MSMSRRAISFITYTKSRSLSSFRLTKFLSGSTYAPTSPPAPALLLRMVATFVTSCAARHLAIAMRYLAPRQRALLLGRH